MSPTRQAAQLGPLARQSDEGLPYAQLAAETMASIGAEGWQVVLQEALEKENPACAGLIAARGDARGRDILAKCLSKAGAVREDAADLLAELGDERCVDVLAARIKMGTR